MQNTCSTEVATSRYFYITHKIDQEISILKQNNNLIHISEFNQIISDFLQKNPPFIYEKIGNRYSHYFIDEFQDTSNTV